MLTWLAATPADCTVAAGCNGWDAGSVPSATCLAEGAFAASAVVANVELTGLATCPT